jgi:hypothetical protein
VEAAEPLVHVGGLDDHVAGRDGHPADGVEQVISAPTQARTKEFLRRVLDPTHIEIEE